MNPTLKRYLISSTVTFLAAFLLTLGSNLDSLSFETVEMSTIWAILFTSARAGIKALAEFFVLEARK